VDPIGRSSAPAGAGSEGEGHVNSLVGLINGAWRYLHRPRAWPWGKKKLLLLQISFRRSNGLDALRSSSRVATAVHIISDASLAAGSFFNNLRLDGGREVC
jgi:hypothetical protein